jgi:molybdate transport system substrate-binding protein
VFLSADMLYPEKLQQEGFATTPPRVYAYGSLVLWTMHPLDLGNWEAVLNSPAVKRIAIANPKTAPYGREALFALRSLGMENAIKDKLVFGESVSQTNQYIESRAVDAGFTAKSVVLSPEMRDKGRWIDLPRGSYQPIAQGAVILRHGAQTNGRASEQFFDHLFSRESRAILARYGYLLP